MTSPETKVSISNDEALARKLQEEEDRARKNLYTQSIDCDEILARMLQEEEDREYENSKKRKAEIQNDDWLKMFRKPGSGIDPQETLTSDRELAQQLQLEEEEEYNRRAVGSSTETSVSSSDKDPDKLGCYLDTEDPNPDLHELFVVFDKQFFDNKLAAVEVCYM